MSLDQLHKSFHAILYALLSSFLLLSLQACVNDSALHKENMPATLATLPDGLKGTDSKSVREWYLVITAAPRMQKLNAEWVQQGLTTEQRAKKTYEIRHDARITARSFMENKQELADIQARDLAKYGSPDGPTFEQEVNKCRDRGLHDDAAYECIIESASRTDPVTNAKYGMTPQ